MIRLHVKPGLLGEGQVTTERIAWRRGLTARHLLELVRDQLPQSVDIGVAVNGRRSLGEDLDAELPRTADVVVGAAPAGIEIGAIIVYALISTAVSIAVGYVASLLTPKPKAPGVPQERGDDTSPTYAWDGATTSYGPGMPIPWGYGRHHVAGQVIYTDVFAQGALTGGAQRELLNIVVALCEGPIWRVGDTLMAERDGLGGLQGDPPGARIPTELRLQGNLLDAGNQTPGARVWLRPGNLNQAPLPSNPFRGTTSTFTVGLALNEDNAVAVFTFAATDDVTSCLFTMTFPSGIYGQDGQGNVVAAPVDVEFSWRPQGDLSWRNFFRPATSQPLGNTRFGTQPVLGGTSATIGADLISGAGSVRGPIEVRARRIAQAAPPAGVQVVNQATFRQVGFNQAQLLAYPRVALIGLQVEASGRLSGSTPQFLALCDLKTVRVWDQSLGWSAECWDVPAAPFNWMQHPPGRNPAWIALDFLLAPWGLGNWLTEHALDLDLPAFRRWSIFCDQDPNFASPWNEASHCFDGLGDSPRDAWVALISICAAGRATPLRVGNQITVIYQYRDAHFDSLVTVPAKAPVQLFSSANVEDLQVTWMPKATRPTAVQYQFLNEAKLHSQDVLILEDFESNLNDPTATSPDLWRPQVIQAYGVCRESQLQRDGMFFHRTNRLVEREVTFSASPQAIAMGPGDLFELECDILRPFAADVPMSCTVRQGGTNVTAVVVDHVVTGTGLEVVVRDPNGEPQRASVSSLTAISSSPPLTQLNLAAAVDCDPGAPAVVGKAAKLTEVYQCVNRGAAHGLKVQVRGLQWVPEVYDPLARADFGDATIGPSAPRQSFYAGPPMAQDLQLRAAKDGGHMVSWTSPGQSSTRAARVWMLDQEVGVWALLAEVVGNQAFVQAFVPWRRATVAVSLQNDFGTWTPPESSTRLDVTPEEFALVVPPPARRLVATSLPLGLLLQWEEQDGRDLAHFEVRAGRSWSSATPVARTRAAEVVLPSPRIAGTYQVAARWRGGLYGPSATVSPSAWTPPDRADKVARDELASSPTGTLTDVSYDGAAKELTIASGKLLGTYLTIDLDPGYVAPWYWQVRWDAEERDGGTVGDDDFPVGGGDSAWCTTEARAASPALPGGDFDDLVSDDDGPLGDLPVTATVGGVAGELGANSEVLVESRVHDGTAYGPWRPHRDGIATGRKLQVRVTMRRIDFARNRALVQLDLHAFI